MMRPSAYDVVLKHWSDDDLRACVPQGWSVFAPRAVDDDGVERMIQRLDEPGHPHWQQYGSRVPKDGGPRFKSDAEAEAYVHKRAAEGCPVAQKAVALVTAYKLMGGV